MTDQPTLDGLTAPQFLEVCHKNALRSTKEQIAAHPDMNGMRPLNRAETTCINIGISEGMNAMFQELLRRGLIVERP